MRYMPMDRREMVRRIRDFVKEQRNYRRLDLSTADVAEALGIARSSLIKVMREDMQCSFAEYLLRVRLQRGRHMVMTNKGRFSMEHIALVSGFSTLRTFNNKYKEAYGELPSETDKHNTHGF